MSFFDFFFFFSLTSAASSPASASAGHSTAQHNWSAGRSLATASSAASASAGHSTAQHSSAQPVSRAHQQLDSNHLPQHRLLHQRLQDTVQHSTTSQRGTPHQHVGALTCCSFVCCSSICWTLACLNICLHQPLTCICCCCWLIAALQCCKPARQVPPTLPQTQTPLSGTHAHKGHSQIAAHTSAKLKSSPSPASAAAGSLPPLSAAKRLLSPFQHRLHMLTPRYSPNTRHSQIMARRRPTLTRVCCCRYLLTTL